MPNTRDKLPSCMLADAPDELELELELAVEVPVELLSSEDVDEAVLVDLEAEAVLVELP